ncbi:MAG: putative rane protein [Acidimicrobiaceae bacterium]|nr:putative rane protein [Acidimicrobiaceae bacterium]
MAAQAQRRSLLGRMGRAAESLPVRIVVTLSLLAVVATHIDWSRMEGRLRHGHPLNLVAAVGLVLGALTIGAYRWRRLLMGAGVHMGLRSLARVYSVATFSGTFLPTTLGADVTRALLVTRRGPLLTRVVMTIVVDRLGGLVGLLGMAWISFSLQSTTVPSGAQIFLAWVTAIVAIGSLLLAVALFRGSRLARAIVPAKLTQMARESRTLLRGYARDPRTLVVLLVSSLLYQALISLQLVMLAHAIDVHLPFATAAVTLALVTIVTLIPISIGGFGVREGSYVVLLGAASIAATDATLISVLSVAALFLASLPGAFMFARGGVGPAVEAAPQ